MNCRAQSRALPQLEQHYGAMRCRLYDVEAAYAAREV